MTQTIINELLTFILSDRDYREVSTELASELVKYGVTTIEDEDDAIFENKKLVNVQFRKLKRVWSIPAWNSFQKAKSGSPAKYKEQRELEAYIHAEHLRKIAAQKELAKAERAEFELYASAITSHFKRIGLPEVVIEKTIIKSLTLDTAKAMVAALNATNK